MPFTSGIVENAKEVRFGDVSFYVPPELFPLSENTVEHAGFVDRSVKMGVAIWHIAEMDDTAPEACHALLAYRTEQNHDATGDGWEMHTMTAEDGRSGLAVAERTPKYGEASTSRWMLYSEAGRCYYMEIAAYTYSKYIKMMKHIQATIDISGKNGR